MAGDPDEPAAQAGKARATAGKGGSHPGNGSGGASGGAGQAGAFTAAGENSAGRPDDPASSGGARSDAGAGQAGTLPEGGVDAGGASGAAGAEGCGTRDSPSLELQGDIVPGKIPIPSAAGTTPNGGQTGIWERCLSITPSCQDHLDAGAGGTAGADPAGDLSFAPSLADDGYATVNLQTDNLAYAINDQGHIVGASGSCSSGAFLYKDGVFFDIAKGYFSSVANDINAAGVVVGSVGTQPRRPFVFRDGILHVLEEFEEEAAAVAINDQDQVLVASRTGGYLWQAGQVTELDASGSSCACVVRPRGINNRGQVVGNCDDGAFSWQDGVMTELSTFGMPSQEASAINDAGQIVGMGTQWDGRRVAVLWDGGTVRALEWPSGPWTMIPTAINVHGTITFMGAEGAPAYANGTWKQLGGYLKGPPPWQECGFNRTEAFDVNASGQIVGFGDAECVDRDDRGILARQGMLWSPTCVGSCCPK